MASASGRCSFASTMSSPKFSRMFAALSPGAKPCYSMIMDPKPAENVSIRKQKAKKNCTQKRKQTADECGNSDDDDVQDNDALFKREGHGMLQMAMQCLKQECQYNLTLTRSQNPHTWDAESSAVMFYKAPARNNS
ncbi:hypothetical protein BT96DRAFT_1056232 [Gymnopus androsaceus JB14]|uniref:Uncharacterized protein n=1 Tax=Gymnopus androsaceus JB14 TaxID=1447944 RepID=A0A6A4H3E3_9AGAR|nr:hypothetical protein BT96DRAFT_1056232 [Gymnopus androsaceus JB14]